MTGASSTTITSACDIFGYCGLDVQNVETEYFKR